MTTGFVPIESLLRHLQEELLREAFIPIHVYNCLQRLVGKVETLKPALQMVLNKTSLSTLAFDGKKLRIGIQSTLFRPVQIFVGVLTFNRLFSEL